MRQRAQADRGIPYERHKGRVLRVVARRCPWLATDECEVAYHDAYATLLEKHRVGALDMDAMHDRQVLAYLTTTAIRDGLVAGRRGGHPLTIPMEDPGTEVLDPELPTGDRAATHSEPAPISELVEKPASMSLRECSSQSFRFAVAFARLDDGGRTPTSTGSSPNGLDLRGGSKSARSCNCIVQGMSGRGAAGHLAGRWRPISQRGTAAFWCEPATHGGRRELGEEAS
jgi:hypothetical protein